MKKMISVLTACVIAATAVCIGTGLSAGAESAAATYEEVNAALSTDETTSTPYVECDPDALCEGWSSQCVDIGTGKTYDKHTPLAFYEDEGHNILCPVCLTVETKAHEWVYTSNGDGTHTASCHCTYEKVENCSGDGICDYCGASLSSDGEGETVEEPTTEETTASEETTTEEEVTEETTVPEETTEKETTEETTAPEETTESTTTPETTTEDVTEDTSTSTPEESTSASASDESTTSASETTTESASDDTTASDNEDYTVASSDSNGSVTITSDDSDASASVDDTDDSTAAVVTETEIPDTGADAQSSVLMAVLCVFGILALAAVMIIVKVKRKGNA